MRQHKYIDEENGFRILANSRQELILKLIEKDRALLDEIENEIKRYREIDYKFARWVREKIKKLFA